MRRSLRAWTRHLLDEELTLGARLPRSVGALLFRPGHLTAEWIAGRRQRYVPPLRLLLLALVGVIVVSFTVKGSSSGVGAAFTSGYRDALPDAYWGPDLSSFQEGAAATPVELAQEQDARTTLNWLIITLIPVIAVVLRLLFRGGERYFVDHLVFSVHLATFFLLLAALFWLGLALSVALGGIEPLEAGIAGVLTASVPLYLFLALSRTYAESKAKTAGKALILLLVIPAVSIAGFVGVSRVRGGGAGLAQSERAFAYYRHADSLRTAGDSLELRHFGPAVVAEFQRVPYGTATTHHRIHLAEVELWLGQPAAALQTAEEVLAQHPRDLLLLGLAARASRMGGRDSLAGVYRERFRTVWDSLEAGAREEEFGHPELLEELHRELRFPPSG